MTILSVNGPRDETEKAAQGEPGSGESDLFSGAQVGLVPSGCTCYPSEHNSGTKSEGKAQMTVYRGVNGFGNSAGDSITENCTKYGGRGGFPEGKLKRYPSAVSDISGGNRRLAKSNHGDGGGSGTSVRGTNAFSKGGKKR